MTNQEIILNLIEKQTSKFPEDSRLEGCKKNLIDYVSNKRETYNSLPKEQMENEKTFLKNYLKNQLTEYKKREAHYKKHIKSVIKLETHAYAPELNKLHLTDNRVIRTPEATDIRQAIEKYIPKN
jgi:hypothetical protein